MKIEADRDLFLESIQKVVAVIEKTQTIKILGNVLIKTGEESVYCTGSDSNVQLISKSAARILEAGATSVPATKFHDICRYLPECERIRIEVRDNKMEIRSGKGFFSLKILSSNDYPVLTMGTIDNEIVIEGIVLKNAIEKVSFCMGLQDVRRFLNGLYFSGNSKVLEIIASDGHRLARIVEEIENVKDTGKLFIPRKAAMELSRIIDNGDSLIKLQFSGKRIGAITRDMEFIAKLSEERFPDYTRVIPTRSSESIEIEKNALKEALVRVAILSDQISNGVLFTFEDQKLSLKSNNSDQENAEEKVDINFQGEKMVVGFNARYVLDALQKIDSKKVLIDINPEKHSMLIMGDRERNTNYLVMPIKL